MFVADLSESGRAVLILYTDTELLIMIEDVPRKRNT